MAEARAGQSGPSWFLQRSTTQGGMDSSSTSHATSCGSDRPALPLRSISRAERWPGPRRAVQSQGALCALMSLTKDQAMSEETKIPTHDEIRATFASVRDLVQRNHLCLDATIDDYPIGRRQPGKCRLQRQQSAGKGYR